MRNPGLKRKGFVLPDQKQLVQRLKQGDKTILSRLITLTESKRTDDRLFSEQLIQEILPFTGNSIRIGITGVPGVGKSTFIEMLGMRLLEQGHKIAVLAVDPSSPVSGGSILGDKTRMEKLSTHPHTFIRPTAAGNTLGGVGARTRETILLCEAAGYDTLIIETVGVGQSETLVHGITDFFLLLMLPGAGDELQGMKKGIVEMADLLVIHKADGDAMLKAKIAMKEYQHALHLLPAKEHAWTTDILLASSLSGMGIENVLEKIDRFKSHMKESGWFIKRRQSQNQEWYNQTIMALASDYVTVHPARKEAEPGIRADIRKGILSPVLAARRVFEIIKNNII